MTKQIISEFLLVSGRNRPYTLIELERHCEKAGFRLNRSGEFGIGVLSYFMIADLVEIRTRPHLDYYKIPQEGWKFTTKGVGSFGELRKIPRDPNTVYLNFHPTVLLATNHPIFSIWYQFLMRSGL